jgi:hypothetical protein
MPSARDSASINIIVEDDDTTYPARVDLGSGADRSRETPPGPFVVSALSTGGGHTALLKTDDAALAEVFALEDGQLRKLTAHNDALLAELKLGSVENSSSRARTAPKSMD